MRILYGVVGEGMGHAVRSKVLLDYLVENGHELLIVVSGRAHAFLEGHFGGRAGVRIEKIGGLRLDYEGNALDLRGSIAMNLEDLPENLIRNTEVYRRVAEMRFRPQAVISDFESWAYLYGRAHRVPVISVDNMKVMDRCRHDREIIRGGRLGLLLGTAAVRAKLPTAYHYLISSFFFPSIRKARTTLVPPILRREVLALRRQRGSHVLVYQTASSNQNLVPTLRGLPYEFRVYGMGREWAEGNVVLKAFSEPGFLEDLRTASGVISNGGYSLMGEAVHLRVPMLSVPVQGHPEQELNARYLAHLGYGMHGRDLDGATVLRFLEQSGEHEAALRSYPSQDNSLLYACLDELLWRIGRGEPPPAALSRAPVYSLRPALADPVEAPREPIWTPGG